MELFWLKDIDEPIQLSFIKTNLEMKISANLFDENVTNLFGKIIDSRV